MPTTTYEQPTRETVSTIRSDGSRAFLFPMDARGRYTQARRYSAYGLIAFYLSLPWIQINGYPAAFLDLAGRRFHLFGLTFATQDLWLLFFVISGLGFGLFFLTALFGRIWCGWACPHTVFLDHVYRRIERWIDGDALQRRRLAGSPWTFEKARKRAAKHTLYLLISAVITHLFLAYFVSWPEVWSMICAAPGQHWGAFAFIAISTGALYFNFAWFREQLCIVICPYGRMQSALIDQDTVVIGYDAKRGEPRGKLRRPAGPGATPADGVSSFLPSGAAATASAPSPKAGDCVDCARCVQVCPTGIDIRQGLQMECIGCTACIDACDDVMTRLRRPTGLIRYDSSARFSGRRTRWVRARTILYFGLLLAGAGVAIWAVSTVKAATLSVTRMTGAPYVVDATTVRNQFLVRIVNKRNAPASFIVRLEGAPAGAELIGLNGPMQLDPLEERVQPLIVRQSRSAYRGAFSLQILAADDARSLRLAKKVQFLGPEAALLQAGEANHGR